MYTIHGLVRARDVELGIDEDTGGQIVYVLELAKALSRRPEVEKVDIITRKIKDGRYPGYDRDREKISGKVNLVRLPCGPDKYIKKVDLWPYLDEFTERAEIYIKEGGRKPDIIQSNYADGGFVGRKLAQKFSIPLVHISHSLAKPEIKRLRESGEDFKKIIEENHFERQVLREQEVIDSADAIIVSSKHEKKIQYGEYGTKNLTKTKVIPPGIDFEKFSPYKLEETSEKPIVLAMARMDVKKNLVGAVKIFSQDEEFREKAKLFVASSTFGASNLSGREKRLVSEIKKEIKKERLENVVSLVVPNNHGGPANLYKRTAQSGGVFVNPALFEGFGLTTLEAGACGVPVVVTKNGGPFEVVKKCKNGILVDPLNMKEATTAIKKILQDKKLWEKFSKNGIKNVSKYYSWNTAAKKQVKLFKKLPGRGGHLAVQPPSKSPALAEREVSRKAKKVQR